MQDVIAALQGIQRAKATGTTDAVLGLFEGLTKDPSKDKGKAEGEIRRELARTLGILKDAKAVPALIAALQQPTEMRPEVGAAVPLSTPGASTSTFSGPSGSHFGLHSSSRIFAERPRPPSSCHFAGNGFSSTVWFVMST